MKLKESNTVSKTLLRGMKFISGNENIRTTMCYEKRKRSDQKKMNQIEKNKMKERILREHNHNAKSDRQKRSLYIGAPFTEWD